VPACHTLIGDWLALRRQKFSSFPKLELVLVDPGGAPVRRFLQPDSMWSPARTWCPCGPFLQLAQQGETEDGRHLARINEIPPDPQQNLVPWAASYLAGLAAVKSDAPSIVPDLTYGDDLEIPAFLRRPTKEEVV
jgi:hypothetical protein